MRRVSLLTATAAGSALVVLVVAGAVAAALADRPAVLALTVVSALAAALGLVVGWRPALAVSTGMAVVAGVVAVTPRPSWPALVVLGGAAVIGQETARVSIDLRRPARLGPGVLRGVAVRVGAAVAAGAVAALAADLLADRRVATWWVPVALVLAALPVALPRLGLDGPVTGPTTRSSGTGAGRDPIGSRGTDRLRARWTGAPGPVRLTVAAGLSAVVLGSALAGAAARQGIVAAPATTGAISRAVTDDAEPDTGPPVTVPVAETVGPRPGGHRTINIALLALASALVILLVAGLRRNQIPLDTEPIDVGPGDPGLDIVAPRGAEMEDEVVTLADEVAAALVADITVDLRSEPDPGRAVRYAYARVEQRLADQGMARRPAESEPEYLARALGALGDDGRALAELTRLFERARFSDAPVPEAMRAAALEALDRLHRRLETSR